MVANPKPKFLKTLKERISADNVRRALDTRELVRIALDSKEFSANADQALHDLAGPQAQSKGGKAKAAIKAAEITARDQELRAEFDELMKSPGVKRHEVVGKLAKARDVPSERINRSLRRTSGSC